MAVASCSPEGQPSLRYVLLKGYDDRGFVFYTNYNSRKGQELASGAKTALAFWWEGLQRQVWLLSWLWVSSTRSHIWNI